MQKELEQRKTILENAKQVRKHAKASLKAEMKAIKAQLKPFKLAQKQAQKVEQEAKKAYKSLLKEIKKAGVAVEKEPKQLPDKPKRQERKPKEVSAPVAVNDGIKPSGKSDDLTKIKGIGDAVADMLQANGVKSFADMANTSYDRFKELLRANNMSRYRNPLNWAKEAGALAKSGPVALDKKSVRPSTPRTKKKPVGRPKTTAAKSKQKQAL